LPSLRCAKVSFLVPIAAEDRVPNVWERIKVLIPQSRISLYQT
jgi:hypothetical protein